MSKMDIALNNSQLTIHGEDQGPNQLRLSKIKLRINKNTIKI